MAVVMSKSEAQLSITIQLSDTLKKDYVQKVEEITQMACELLNAHLESLSILNDLTTASSDTAQLLIAQNLKSEVYLSESILQARLGIDAAQGEITAAQLGFPELASQLPEK